MIDGVERGRTIPPPFGESPSTFVVLEGEGYRIGAIRFPPSHPRWNRENSNPGLPVLSFPRQPMRILLSGGGGGVIDAGCAVYLPSEQRFRCECVSAGGEQSDWFAFSPELVERLAPGLDLEDRGATRITVQPREHELQRRTFRHALVAPQPDHLLLEEALCGVLELLHRSRGKPLPAPRRADRIANDLKAILAVRFKESLHLDDLAAELGVSPHHLCREFRKEAGTTIHGHRELLRFASALNDFEQGGEDLTGLALELGYSSHAHFSANFKRVFGVAPSRLRAAIRHGRLATR